MIIDKTTIQKIVTPARPKEKGNEIWEVTLNGQRYRCERPFYYNDTLNTDIYTQAFAAESQLIFGEALPFFFDQDGRWFAHPKLCSQEMLQYFIANPLAYLKIARKKTELIRSFLPILQEINVTLGWNTANGEPQTYVGKSYLTRNRNELFDQTNWLTPGQSDTSDTTTNKYWSTTNIDGTTLPGSIKILGH